MNGNLIVEALRSSSFPPVVVAELSGNHRGELEHALDLVDAAADSGADAVKLQTYRPDTITINSREDRFLITEGLWAGRYLTDLYAEAMTPWEWHPQLNERAAEHGMALFSSPFDDTAVDFLEASIDPPLHKIASFELNHFPLLRKIAQTGKPVAASVGASTSDEIGEAVALLQTEGCPLIILLQCVSQYPASPKDFHLASLVDLAAKFNVLSGLSDHSSGHIVPVVATTLGARLIEKHLVLDRNDGSIDAGFSMEPHEFQDMVNAVHSAHASLGEARIGLKDDNHPSRRFRRSIFVSSSIRKGEELTPENLRIARPSDGLSPALWDEVLGKAATCDMEPGHPLALGNWGE